MGYIPILLICMRHSTWTMDPFRNYAYMLIASHVSPSFPGGER